MLNKGLVYEVKGKLKDAGYLARINDLKMWLDEYLKTRTAEPTIKSGVDDRLMVEGSPITKRLYMRMDKINGLKDSLVSGLKNFVLANKKTDIYLIDFVTDATNGNIKISGLNDFFGTILSVLSLDGTTVNEDGSVTVSGDASTLDNDEKKDVIMWVFEALEKEE